ncbi:NYN domain-containing protein [Nocardia anaemiae]|uniref:NYN domain-containing protein n=1 Tax=Nocardia anaemiae TaxID=263910 RepID=UPI000AEF3F73
MSDWAVRAGIRENGIDLIQLGRFPSGSHKNAVDMRLAVDATETLIAPAGIGIFVLLTGNSDFTSLVQTLRDFGKHVISISDITTSARLVSFAASTSSARPSSVRLSRASPPDRLYISTRCPSGGPVIVLCWAHPVGMVGMRSSA